MERRGVGRAPDGEAVVTNDAVRHTQCDLRLDLHEARWQGQTTGKPCSVRGPWTEGEYDRTLRARGADTLHPHDALPQRKRRAGAGYR
jgi:hypothetical protein